MSAQPQTGLSLRERADGYMSLIGPMMMILAIILVMLVLEPARYFRLSNFDIILKDQRYLQPLIHDLLPAFAVTMETGHFRVAQCIRIAWRQMRGD